MVSLRGVLSGHVVKALVWRYKETRIESRCLHCAIFAGLNLQSKNFPYMHGSKGYVTMYAVGQASGLALPDGIQTQSREEVLG